MKYLSAICSNFINFILPYRCISCSEILADNNSLCAKCFSNLHFITQPLCHHCGVDFAFPIEGKILCGKCIFAPPKYDCARSLLKFNEHSKKLIHRFKYNDHTAFGKIFARHIIARYRTDIEGNDVIIPVPMNKYKRLFRQYNPPQILAQYLAELSAIPMLADALIKTKWTKGQTYLTRRKRQKNLQGSIITNKVHALKGLKIILVDDVKTTGSTAEYCAKQLKKAGASKVTLITICSV
jgi:ComF family protein